MKIFNSIKNLLVGTPPQPPVATAASPRIVPVIRAGSPVVSPARPEGRLAPVVRHDGLRLDPNDPDFFRKSQMAYQPPPPPPKPKVDPWNARFERPPYFNSNNFCQSVNKTALLQIAKQAGAEFVLAAEIEGLKLISVEHAQLIKDLNGLSMESVRLKLVKIINDNHEAEKRGDSNAIQTLPDRTLLENQIRLEQQAIQQRLAALRVRTLPILETIADRIEAAAKRVATDLADTEERQAAAFGMEPTVSPMLITAVFLALRCKGMVRGQVFGWPGRCLWGLLDTEK